MHSKHSSRCCGRREASASSSFLHVPVAATTRQKLIPRRATRRGPRHKVEDELWTGFCFAHRAKLDLKSRQAGVAREVPRCPAPRDRRRRILMRHGHPNCPSPRGCKEGKEDSHTAQHHMHLLERLRMRSSEQSPSILQILRHLHHLYRQNCQLLPTICTAAAAAAALKTAANGNVAMQISGELTRCLWTA